MRLGVNEFQTFVNCLPVAAVCSEARSVTAAFCRTQAPSVDLFYAPGPPSGVQVPVGDEDESEADISESILAKPTTVMLTYGRHESGDLPGFESAAHLVDVVERVFGNGVERIVLGPWLDAYESLEAAYWPHTAQTKALEYL